MASIEQLATTLQGLAGPGLARKDLIAAVRERHPKASKKDIVRAAFYAFTSAVDGDVERAQRLHDFALSHRAADEAEPLPTKRRKKDVRKDARQSHEPTSRVT